MNIFQSNINNIYGEKGKAWLADLSALVASVSSKMDLRDLKEVENLSFNYVLSGFQGNKPIILKLGLDSEALNQEAFALKSFSGYGAVKVLSEESGLLLLERAVPGTSLKSYFPTKEKESIEIACKVMKKLHQANIPADHNFPHIKDWLKALDRDWNIPNHYLQKARKLRDQLLQTSKPDVLLHGDLHHDNILQNGDNEARHSVSDGGWLVIDPKGVIGSPMNEIWAFVMDIEGDIPLIAKYFDFPVQNLFDWYFVHLMLAICWNLEDNIDSSLFISLANKAYQYTS